MSRAVQAILCLLMDSPAFPAGHSGLDLHAAAPAVRPAPDGLSGLDRTPAHRPAQPVASAQPAAPARATRGAALSAPAPGFDLESLVTE